MQLTSRELVAATFARETNLPIPEIADRVKRLHASASIIRAFRPDTGRMPGYAVERAARMLEGTGWSFVADRGAPAIVRGADKIVLV